jgi:GntR family transcriptional regulator
MEKEKGNSKMTDSLLNKIPAYLRIKMYIQDKIDRGEWVAHSKLPNEEELCSFFNVARGTVRHALSDLVNEGVIYKIHGKGSFVKPNMYEHEIDSNRFISFLEDLSEKGVTFSTELLGMDITIPDDQVRSHLSIKMDIDKVYKIRRLRRIKEQVAMYSVNHIPCTLCPNFIIDKNNNPSVYDQIKKSYGIQIDIGTRILSAVGATKELADIFEVEEGHPLILVEQIVYDNFGRCIDCAYIWLRSDIIKLSVTMKRRKKN